MTRHKKFSGGSKLSDFEPLTFEINDHEFSCLPAIQGSVLLEFVRDADGDNGTDSAKALYNFLSSSMTPDEYTKLQAVLKDPEFIIDIEMIGEIVAWLVEEYASRPTTRPGVSQDGQPTSGPSSTDEDSSKVAV